MIQIMDNITNLVPEVKPPWDRHYTVEQLATIWGFGRATVRQWVENEPGVLRLGESRIRKGRKNPYVSLRVPESVAMRVYRRHTAKK
jgi:hypothetical protein